MATKVTVALEDDLDGGPATLEPFPNCQTT